MTTTVLGFKTYIPGTIPLDLANILSVGLGLTYVGSLYLSKNARLSFSSSKPDTTPDAPDQPRDKESNERWRDDPDVIRARLVAVSSATVVCCVGVYALVGYVGAQEEGSPLPVLTTLKRTAQLLGFKSTTSYLPHLPTVLLYLGPLVASFFRRELPFQQNWRWQVQKQRFFGIVGWRNYWIAPATEELVFRSCVLAVYQLARASKWRMIFVAPLTFGLAHIHHAWDTYNRYGRTQTAAKRAIFSSLFQFVYTTLFGIHTSYLFTRTGSIFPPISAHIFCNVMGVPELGYDKQSAEREWEVRGLNQNNAKGWGKVGRKLVSAAYLGGIALFVITLGSWTRTEGSVFWK
ncbi:CAAX protease self-immunity-domain-containing protein [Panaeolus papilionaceus]|nr:CAAX protease self-immunity-domain-containing protein [Panaeolus papilionaceus]